ncbi:MAG: endo-1,4-beta-xylanase, partial [Thermoproteota archaeon]
MTMEKKTIIAILVLLFALIAPLGFYQTIQKSVEEKDSGISEPSTPIYKPPGNYTLKELASRCGIMIGTCVSYSSLSDNKYREIIASEFSVITPENELKFVLVHPFRSVYTFSRADAIISFAEENGIKVRGHCLVWHQQLPDWILNGNYTREEWIEILRDHIYTVVGRYKGRLYAWDVVNEAFNDDGTLRDTIWLRNIGPEYIKLAFQWAHEADPDALLFYNDYGAEAINRKSNAIYEFVKNLLEEGVPIHGIGLQMHVRVEWYPNPQSVAENIKRFRELGLKVEITEMDVAIRLPVSEEEITKQAEIYKSILKTYLNSD